MESHKEWLEVLTADLVYISESEAGFEVFRFSEREPETVLSQAMDETGAAGQPVERGEPEAFFQPLTGTQDPEDPVASELAARYRELYDYISGHFRRISLFRAGLERKHIYLILQGEEDTTYVLHTEAIET